MLQTAIYDAQHVVSDKLRLKRYKVNVIAAARQSGDSLFDESIAIFEEDSGFYNRKDAKSFIKLHVLRMRIAANNGRSPPQSGRDFIQGTALCQCYCERLSCSH